MWQIPVKTEWMQEQSKHKPSMEYARDIYKVANNLVEFKALEIGGAWGFSTLALFEAGAASLITVDPDPTIHASDEAKANGYSNHKIVQMRSEDFWESNKEKFDLIYIDGSHLYYDVSLDLTEAWKVLNDGGLLLCDDWDHKKNNTVDTNGKFAEYGVSLACWEFFRDAHPANLGINGRVLWFSK